MRAPRKMTDTMIEVPGSEFGSISLLEQQNQQARVMALLAEGLPTLPRYVFQLNSLLAATPVDLNRVAEVIRTDPSLSAQVLRLSNSALFDPKDRAASIEHAVIMLGADRLRTLVLTCSLVEYVDHQFTPVAIHSFWQHSFMTAILSERIARWTAYPKVEQAYMAGLLHDVGILPMLTVAAREHRAFPALYADAWGESLETERKDFGTDHCSIGRWIGVHWNFPAAVVDVFEHHHRPLEALHDPQLVGIVAAADRFCQKRGVMSGCEPNSIDTAAQTHDDDLLRDCLPGLSSAERIRLAELLDTDSLHMTQMLEVSSSGLVGGPIHIGTS